MSMDREELKFLVKAAVILAREEVPFTITQAGEIEVDMEMVEGAVAKKKTKTLLRKLAAYMRKYYAANRVKILKLRRKRLKSGVKDKKKSAIQKKAAKTRQQWVKKRMKRHPSLFKIKRKKAAK